MKWADCLKKGTNTEKKAFSVKFMLCLALTAGLFALCLTENGAQRALMAGTALTYPDFLIKSLKPAEKPAVLTNSGSEQKQTENLAPQANENTVKAVPDDVSKLMAEAEIKYANSKQDGKIITENHSKRNATDEYNGVYLRNATLSHTVNLQEILSREITAAVDKNLPAVLIYHTHTCESYELLDRGFYTNERSTRSENSAENTVRVGEELASALREKGYKVIHDTSVYDEQYSGAYDRSRANVVKILKENPSIQVVLDIHRDSISLKDGSRIKPTAQVNGINSAQIKIITGCEEGGVADFPNWEKNLIFAAKLQSVTADDYPELLTPLMFCSRKYNMDLIPCALQIEIGSDANTLSEAVYSARLLGNSLSKILKECEIK